MRTVWYCCGSERMLEDVVSILSSRNFENHVAEDTDSLGVMIVSTS